MRDAYHHAVQICIDSEFAKKILEYITRLADEHDAYPLRTLLVELHNIRKEIQNRPEFLRLFQLVDIE